MRVGVNAAFLAQPLTGSGRYVRRLLAELDRLGGTEVRAYGLAGTWDAGSAWQPLPTPFDGWARLGGTGAWGASGLRSWGADLAKLWLEQVAFPRACRRAGLDLAHYPYFAAPLSGFRPTVVTIHDAIPLLLPEYRASARVRLYAALVAAAARRAALVLTDSAASRDDLLRLLRLPPERLRVVYLAADERFAPAADPAPVEAARRRYGLPDDYLLYLGGLDHRKNVPRLLAAYALARRQGLRLPLVVAGALRPPGPLFPDLRRQAAALGLGEAVRFCGPGADEDTPRLYQGATAFVFPSLYEGFGLPPLEAMACGTPVVCSDASSLPEVVGDAALLVSPTDVPGLAAALLRVAADRELRAELRRRGLARARQFTWQRTAAATLAAYRAAVEGENEQDVQDVQDTQDAGDEEDGGIERDGQNGGDRR